MFINYFIHDWVIFTPPQTLHRSICHFLFSQLHLPFFFISIKLNLCCACLPPIYVYWRITNLPVVALSRKPDSPSLSSYQLTMAPARYGTLCPTNFSIKTIHIRAPVATSHLKESKITTSNLKSQIVHLLNHKWVISTFCHVRLKGPLLSSAFS